LQAYSPYRWTEWKRQWREVKSGDLRRQLKGIVKELVDEIANISMLVVEAEHFVESRRQQHEQEHQQYLLRERERERVLAQKESREELFRIIESWNEAKRIEAFFIDAERHIEELDDATRLVMLNRLNAAREQLGEINALQKFLTWKSAEERLKDGA
jgi:predicted membrane chloride channel (bestrophin family)